MIDTQTATKMQGTRRTGKHMSEKFDDVEIDGAFIREITLVPSKTVRMILLRAPQNEKENQVSLLSNVQFHQVRVCRANFHAEPWLEIRSHDSPMQSDYLEKYFAGEREKARGGASQSAPEVRLFRIICEEGEIEIIAESFTISLLEEIPHVGSSEPTP